jgi:polysaccharide biosynthesis transport protein
MQVQDTFSVQRRALDIEDYIDIARRHKSWIVGPVFGALVASVVGAFLWPNTYVSTSTIKVVPQQVPEAYVQSNVNQVMSERIIGLAQTVLSRNFLTTMIQSLDLYPRERSRLPMEDVVENMKRDIQIGNVASYSSQQTSRTVPAFQITYSYTDRYKAQKVVSELATKFIDQSQRDRGMSSQGTNQLLKDEWEDAKKEMELYEGKLAEFRQRNSGKLPEDKAGTFQQLNALQNQLGNLNGAISRVSQEKLMLESALRIAKEQAASLKEPAAQEVVLGKSEKLIEAEREVAALERQLGNLREHYTEQFPTVQTAISMLNTAKKKRDQAQKEDDARKPEVRRSNTGVAREQRDLEVQAKRIQSQIDAKDIEAEEYRKEMAQINNSLKSFQSRIEGVPMSEKEYQELLGNRDIARSKFLDLDSKKTKSNLADEMEKRKFGENLEVLDVASLPMTPTSPRREMVISVGTLAGLVLGLLLAGAREMKDTSLKNLKDVRAYTQLPILGSIPLLENDLVVKRRRRISWLGWSIAGLAGIVIMSGSVVYYFVTKN